MVLLSIVIITRNEERNIAGCIESVLAASEGIELEVILADSASTDKTIEIARKYPITIIQLRKEWPLSAASGRYIGFLHAKGKYIQFQDGDTVMYKNWFKYAIPFLDAHKDVAGVTGKITQENYNNVVAKKWVEDSRQQKIGELEYYEQDVLFKKDLIDKIGPFNPYLKAIEEGELSYRVTAKGYKIIRIPYNMSHHKGGYQETYKDMWRRKCLATRAYGQVLRYSLSNKTVLYKWLNGYKYIISFSLLMLYLPFAILLSISGIWVARYAWFAGMILMFIYMLYEKRSASDTINHYLSLAVRWPFFIKGFLENPKSISEYPTDVIVISNGAASDIKNNINRQVMENIGAVNMHFKEEQPTKVIN